jgi:hypothetical protein
VLNPESILEMEPGESFPVPAGLQLFSPETLQRLNMLNLYKIAQICISGSNKKMQTLRKSKVL